MSFEVEFGLPGARPYEYVHVKVSGETLPDLQLELAQFDSELARQLRELHRQAADIMVHRQTPGASAPVANPDRTSISITEDVPRAVAPTAEELITTELGGKVIEVTENVKPWERPKPAATVNLF